MKKKFKWNCKLHVYIIIWPWTMAIIPSVIWTRGGLTNPHFFPKKHQNSHIIMVMQLQKKHAKNWHSHKWQFERTKFKLAQATFTFEKLCRFIIMAFKHNKNHIDTLFYNTIHIEIIVFVHTSFQLLKQMSNKPKNS
jgi:hypothetical protein